MKLAVALGGCAGFTLCAVMGLLARRDPATVLLEACLAAIIGAVLLRWLHLSFVRHVQTALAARRQTRPAVGPSPTAEKVQTTKS